ncbi:MAG: O-linked N-acetylglucosamine transferase, SPINDLY family protein, partial [Sphaerospermopsis sp. SIO1G2]|nr:O-linked N-acetylglucosamine transferase, SPINDLY family protein [Sphaerospermopsis sp. SIO1G2]
MMMMNLSEKIQEGYQYIIEGNYQKAASYFEQVIETEPKVKINYWYLGLCLILQGEEEEATLTWFLGMGDTDDEAQIDLLTLELSQVLEQEAERQEQLDEKKLAWIVRQHLININPTNINNLFSSIRLAVALEILDDEYLEASNIIIILESISDYNSIDSNLVVKVTQEILEFTPLEKHGVDLIKIFTHIIKTQGKNINEFIYAIIASSVKIMSFFSRHSYAAKILEVLLSIAPDEPEILIPLSTAYQNACEYLEGIETAKNLILCCESLPQKVFANHVLIRALMSSTGYWDEACEAINRQKELISALVEESPIIEHDLFVSRLFTSMFFFPYFQDQPEIIRPLQNGLMNLCLKNLEIYNHNAINKYRSSQPINREKNKVLKIAYMSSCLRQHSVGWISRWLFTHHNREEFKIYSYIIRPTLNDNGLQEWFIEQSDHSSSFSSNDKRELIEQIQKDGIDILIDLDSMTFDYATEVLAIKPAPIQVTWLGWDAAGLATIDYFIADDYV